jgi:hypothetical protein
MGEIVAGRREITTSITRHVVEKKLIRKAVEGT